MNKEKNSDRYFNICKDTFLIFEKGNKQKKCARYFKICKYTFLIFEKVNKQNTVPGILRFVGILF